jgi:DNA-binding MarR family transcriptional regulator
MNDEILRLDNQLCFRLYAVSRRMTRLYQPFLEKFNLTYPQYIVMLVMFEHKVMDFKDLSKVVDLKTGTLTPIVQRLEEHGFVSRVKNKQDMRKMNVILTEKGKELQRQVIEVPISMAQQLSISEEMYTVLIKELDDLAQILKTATIEKNE